MTVPFQWSNIYTMELAYLFVSSFIIALSGALMPGPLLAKAVSEGAQMGQVAGPLLVVGHGVLELVLVVALFLGLAPYLQDDGIVAWIFASGGVLLILMAMDMLRQHGEYRVAPAVQGRGRPAVVVLSGAAVSLANPYWTIWWATIGLGYILRSRQAGTMGVIAFMSGHLLADLAFFWVVAFLVSRRRMNPPHLKWVMFSCALFVALFGILFIKEALSRLL